MPQDIPGVWAYLYKNDTNPGENFTRAYSAAKGAKNDEAALKQRADELANRRSEFEGEMGLRKSEQAQRQKEHQDRLDQDTMKRADYLAKEFGPALVIGPDGKQDVQASTIAAMKRIDDDRKSEAYGYVEKITGQPLGPEYDEFKKNPGYAIGSARGLKEAMQKQAQDERAATAHQSALEVAKVRSGGGSSDPNSVPEPKKLNGWWHRWDGKKWVPYKDKENARMNRNEAGTTNAPPSGVVDLVPKAGGGWQKAN